MPSGLMNFFCLWILLLVSCSSNQLGKTEYGLSNLRAELSGKSQTETMSEYEVEIRLVNEGKEAARVNVSRMKSTGFIATYDENGERLFILPPSATLIPSNARNHDWKTIQPGESFIACRYFMTGFSERVRRGRYTMKIESLSSNTLVVDVTVGE